ncbi:hypothetical protein RQM67_08940 [Citrobacter koseri]|uniref:hypothetical protein n=1 Tax=Citrobacter koseri TaxID=545 RepID=UPI001DF95E2E|nr:hypothetical protein [Citrobacter koseri]MDT7494543.1 hypothetical protein [Citrobacter koseri]CAG0245892.1 hypothetical protein AN2351V1_1737 [Citrobacter koseri]CAH6031301.1 hypothetical protein AN2351V1_1737 [Citrobacter koseri]
MTKYLRLTISGLERVVDGILIGGTATVNVTRGEEIIFCENFSGKISGKYSKLYELLDTGVPVSVTAVSDCQFFKAEADFINPFSKLTA